MVSQGGPCPPDTSSKLGVLMQVTIPPSLLTKSGKDACQKICFRKQSSEINSLLQNFPARTPIDKIMLRDYHSRG